MARMMKRRSKKTGLPPGALVYVGEKKLEKVRITIMSYDPERCEEKRTESVAECATFRDAPSVTWLNVDGIHDAGLIQELGRCFGIHSLTLEDIMTASQRPKLEDYGDYLFLVARMLHPRTDGGEERFEQVSMVIGPNFLLSFLEDAGDVFEGVRERLRGGKARIRNQGPDYLAYSLLDAVVDGYFGVLESIGDEIEKLEGEILQEPQESTVRRIHQLKREMIFLRKSVWPLREAIARLERRDSPLVKETTAVFLKDVYDHTIQVIDTVETFRDMLTGMLDTYLTSVSNRMNEVMKVLTLIATIFMPLTFIAGVYGMNFRFMPELGWRWGYWAVLGVMAAVAGTMIVYFKRKKWL
ncbi:MAG: magnesium/cobalt transporter CorA [Candidatus Aminicenantes bacterium]|nr:magnesium/cobalt transporter CorA [Candidatus Aminicenantes bacterium]